jgi:iron(III) transport system permease protein
VTIDLSSLWTTLAFALFGAGVSTLVGGTTGMIAGTRDVAGRKWWIAVSTALLAAPPAFWWIGLTRLPLNAVRLSEPLWGSVVAGIVFAPITLLLVLSAASEIPANAYEAARVSLRPVRRVWDILLPMVRPALLAGFLLTTILLLGESEVPFLFGFRTSMTDIVTTFSQTFDAARTLPTIVPLVVTVLVLGLLMTRSLFQLLAAGAATRRGVIRTPAGPLASSAMLVLPFFLAMSVGGYVRAVSVTGDDAWRRAFPGWPTLGSSIAEPVIGALTAVGVSILIAYPARRSVAIKVFAMVGLLLFCIPTAVTAIGWIVLGQKLNGVSFPPIAAYVSRMVGLAVLGFLVAYTRVPRSMEGAAQLVSVSPVRRAWTLMLPLVAPSLAATAALIAALIFADRDVASLLLAPGQSRMMLNLYLVSANAPSALVGATALIVLAAGGFVIAIAAAIPKVVFSRMRA